ncbi:MAG: amidohydrolase [Gammaproteobacteria bacterium]
MKKQIAVFALAVLPPLGYAQAAEKADLILYNGKVVTVDKDFSIKSAVVVKDGKILAVGGNELADAYTAPKKVDLKGRTLIPGFMDTHLHPMSLPHRAIDPTKAKSIVEIQQELRAKAKELGPGEWITGYGWDEALLTEKRNITRKDLDVATPNNPVVLTRAGGHSSVGNSLALKAAGITRTTEDPKSGLIEHDESGEPNGMIRERNDLYGKLVPRDTWAQMKPGYVKNLKSFLSLGITSMESATGSLDDEPVGQGGVANPGANLTFRRFQQMAAENDIPRITMYTSYPGAERLKQYPHHSGYGDIKVRLGPIGENPVDGGFTGPTAWTLADYKGQPGFRGKGRYTDAELQDMVDTSASLGWQMGLHCIGDAAIQQTVIAYSKALAKYPGLDHKGDNRRWFTDHFTIMPPDATMATMAKDKIMISAQPNFGWNLEQRYVETMDDWRLLHNNPVKTPAKKFGLLVAFASDNLPIDPRVGLYFAVTRRGPDGVQHGFAEEAVSREDAIRMYTANGPYLSWEENIKGTLEPGKLADFVVIDRDPLTVPEKELMTMNFDQTWLGGKLVYERKPGELTTSIR